MTQATTQSVPYRLSPSSLPHAPRPQAEADGLKPSSTVMRAGGSNEARSRARHPSRRGVGLIELGTRLASAGNCQNYQ